MRLDRSAAIRGLLPAALAVLAWNAHSQEPAAGDVVTLRYQRHEGAIVAAEVVSKETGVVQGNVTQGIDGRFVLLQRARDVGDEAATLDDFTLDAGIRITINGQPVVDTEQGLGLDLGELDPRWKCETRRETPWGEVLEAVDQPTDEPLVEVVRSLERMSSLLPEKPVSVGDSWTAEHKPKLAFGEVSATTTWRLDHIEEPDGRRIAVLVSDSEATLSDLAVPEKRLIREINGRQVELRVEEYIVRLEAHHQTTMRFDIAAGAPVDVVGTSSAQFDVTQKVTAGQQVLADHGAPIHLTREGQSTITFRPPTDEELVLTLPVALATSLERKDLALLRTVTAPDARIAGQQGLEGLEAMLRPIFEQNERLDAALSSVTPKVEGATGSVAFSLSVKGGASADSMAPVYEGRFALDARKEGDAWVIAAMEQQ